MNAVIRRMASWAIVRAAAWCNWVFIGLQKLQSSRFRRKTGYEPAAMTLTQLANYYGSDKGDACMFAHGYTRLYEDWLAPIRNESVRILEIGIDQGSQMGAWLYQSTRFVEGPEVAASRTLAGASLQIWSDYLPNAQVHGIDIVDHTHINTDRISVFQADQSDTSQLEAVMKATGGQYDVILDDGSHASLHQQITFGVLFRHLKPGGQYIIEDLALRPPFEKQHRLEYPGLQTTDEVCRAFQQTGELTLSGVTSERQRELHAMILNCDLHMEVGWGVCRFVRK